MSNTIDYTLTDTGDLFLDSSIFPSKIEGEAAIGQIIKQHLKLWKNNYPYDSEYGTDWTVALVKNPNTDIVVQSVTASLVQLDFVEQVIDVYLSIDKTTRQGTVTYIIIVDGAEFTGSEVI